MRIEPPFCKRILLDIHFIVLYSVRYDHKGLRKDKEGPCVDLQFKIPNCASEVLQPLLFLGLARLINCRAPHKISLLARAHSIGNYETTRPCQISCLYLSLVSFAPIKTRDRESRDPADAENPKIYQPITSCVLIIHGI